MDLVFGPVPSRRLGQSLGINNVPPKTCTYSCVYCQLGRTLRMETERRSFYAPEEIVRAVQTKLADLQNRGEEVDHLTFVPDGEPTLDVNLGKEIQTLKELGVPTAVITNGSLIDHQDVQAELRAADWVSLKIDAVSKPGWRRVNRPHRRLSLPAIQDGILHFSRAFAGTLVTETMLVSGVNDDPEDLCRTADFLREVSPRVAYLAIPTRPPAEQGVRPPPEARLFEAHAIFSERLTRVELLIGYEGDAFAASGDPARDLLSITAVHPMREGAVRDLLERDGADWGVVEGLIRTGNLVELAYQGYRFYMRALPGRRPRTAKEARDAAR